MSSHIGQKSIIVVNSANRRDGTSSNFRVQLKLPNDNKYDHCSALQINIPKSFYCVPKKYNTFILLEGNTQVVITIPEGNYSMLSFQNILQQLLNLYSPNAITYTMAYESIEALTVDIGKFNWSLNDPKGNAISFIMPDNSFICNVMGFNKNSTNTFSNSNKLQSVNCVSFQSHDTILIKSNIVANETNLLQEVLCSSQPYNGSIVYQNNNIEMNSKSITNSKDNIYSFVLTSVNDEEIDLNGLDWTMSIVLYQHNDSAEYIKSDIQLKHIKELIKQI